MYAKARSLRGEGDSDAARTGAEIGYQSLSVFGEATKHGLDQAFGLRTRNQDPRIDFERPVVKLSDAGEVLSGLALRPTFDQLTEGPELVLAQRTVEVDVKPDAVLIQHGRDKHLRCQARRIDFALLEVLRGPAQHLPNGPGLGHCDPGSRVCAFSASAW